MASTRLPSARRTTLTVPDVGCSWLMSRPRASSTSVGGVGAAAGLTAGPVVAPPTAPVVDGGVGRPASSAAGEASATAGSRSSTRWSRTSFHGWNQASPRATATAATSATEPRTSLRRRRRRRRRRTGMVATLGRDDPDRRYRPRTAKPTVA